MHAAEAAGLFTVRLSLPQQLKEEEEEEEEEQQQQQQQQQQKQQQQQGWSLTLPATIKSLLHHI